MKKLNIIFRYLIIILLSTSCTDKAYELNPVSQISNASFWKKQGDVEAGLIGMYSRLRTQAGANFFMWGEARSEILGPSVAGPVGQEYWDNVLTPLNVESQYGGQSATWQGLYSVLHDANLILKHTPNISFVTQPEKNRALAEAYTTRAFVYYWLVRLWGDVPLVTEPSEGYEPETVFKARAPKSEIFKLIKQDINKAIELFPEKWRGDIEDFPPGRCRWSKPAANALRADIYLWTGKRESGGQADFNEALKSLNLIEATNVGLLDNFGSIFTYSNKGNKEIIMSIRFQDLEPSGVPRHTNTLMGMASLFMTSYADAATNLNTPMGGLPHMAPTALVRSQFSNDDSRRDATFYEIYESLPKNNGVKTYYTSVMKKFHGLATDRSLLEFQDFVLYRYADILLMKAEAKNALGQDPSMEINKVRQRAYGANFAKYVFVNGTKVQNDDAILKERLLEFMFESKRWFDLVRFGKAFELVPSLKSRAGQEGLLLFPIAESELNRNRSLVQNPAYKF